MNFAAGALAVLMASTLSLPAKVEPAVQPVEQRYVLAFAGDIHFEAGLRKYARAGGLDSIKSLYDDSDFVMANLETAITSRGVKEKKNYTFRAPASAVDALTDANITVVTMANNHALDYGSKVLGDTFQAFRGKSVGLVGIGANQEQALTPFRTAIGEPGQQLQVSVFGIASDEMLGDGLLRRWSATARRGGIATWNYHQRLLKEAIATEREAGRFVIIYVHWGIELDSCPTQKQREILTQLEAAGASLVVGTHPHILQPAGFTDKGTPVIFSTGNFVWYHGRGGPTGVVKVTVVNGKAEAISITPAYIVNGLPRIRESAQGAVERSLFGQACSPLLPTLSVQSP